MLDCRSGLLWSSRARISTLYFLPPTVRPSASDLRTWSRMKSSPRRRERKGPAGGAGVVHVSECLQGALRCGYSPPRRPGRTLRFSGTRDFAGAAGKVDWNGPAQGRNACATVARPRVFLASTLRDFAQTPASGLMHRPALPGHRHDKFGYWQDVVCRALVDLECRPMSGMAFEASVEGSRLEGLSVARIEASAHRVERQPSAIARASEESLIFNFVLSGVAMAQQDGRSVVLRAGDGAVCDAQRPYSLRFDDTFKIITIKLARSAIAHRAGSIHRITATSFGESSQMCPILFRVPGELQQAGIAPAARCLGEGGQELHRAAGRSPRRSHPGLTAAAVRIPRNRVDAREGLRGAPPRRVRTRHGHGEHRLEPVAALHQQAVRSREHIPDAVHLAPALERAAADLQDPARAGLGISAIAMAHGFNDLSHFSRAFRQRFDLSPRAYRASGIASGASTIAHRGGTEQGHVAHQLVGQDLQHGRCALLPAHRQAVERGPTHEHCRGAQGQGLRDVAAAPDSAVHEHGDAPGDRTCDARQRGDRRGRRIVLAAAMVRHDQAVDAVVERHACIVRMEHALEKQRPLPHSTKPRQRFPDERPVHRARQQGRLHAGRTRAAAGGRQARCRPEWHAKSVAQVELAVAADGNVHRQHQRLVAVRRARSTIWPAISRCMTLKLHPLHAVWRGRAHILQPHVWKQSTPRRRNADGQRPFPAEDPTEVSTCVVSRSTRGVSSMADRSPAHGRIAAVPRGLRADSLRCSTAWESIAASGDGACFCEANERQQGLRDRQLDVQGTGQFYDGTVDALHLGTATGQHVLQHGGLVSPVVVDGVRHIGPAFGGVDVDAQAQRDGQHFRDDLVREAAAVGQPAEFVDRAAGYRADAVQRGVEGDLLPDRRPHGTVGGAIEPAFVSTSATWDTKRRSTPSAAMSRTTPWPWEVHVAGTDHVRWPCGDADQHPLQRHELRDLLDIAQAVLQRQHMHPRSDQVPYPGQGRAGVQCLGEHQEQIGEAGGVFRSHGLQRRDLPVTAVGRQAKPLGADRIDVRVVLRRSA
ncbi:araC-binding-like domain-containing protein [Ditylenchus destructor]|uniref:AraC-binding-like domain-containing protein n=1 Tax=Ditylenchus destructor TaxID=166010 RepID=A0AAD4MFZ0_9BILA|nr:araC-binding-like domain-containing protein [Ditylenchus destructor]